MNVLKASVGFSAKTDQEYRQDVNPTNADSTFRVFPFLIEFFVDHFQEHLSVIINVHDQTLVISVDISINNLNRRSNDASESSGS